MSKTPESKIPESLAQHLTTPMEMVDHGLATIEAGGSVWAAGGIPPWNRVHLPNLDAVTEEPQTADVFTKSFKQAHELSSGERPIFHESGLAVKAVLKRSGFLRRERESTLDQLSGARIVLESADHGPVETNKMRQVNKEELLKHKEDLINYYEQKALQQKLELEAAPERTQKTRTRRLSLAAAIFVLRSII